jgi:NAD(P)H-hydrate repair Nnr-like enzyme with NAD(P)H-hydrate dehydratase domain
MMAQGLAPFDATVCNAYVHGAAGERWRARHGNIGLLAGKLTDLIPDVVGALSAQQWLPSCLT